MRLAKNPSIATRRDSGADRCAMRRACQRNPSKMARKLPQNRGTRSDSVGRGNRGTMLRCLLALLACLERAPGQAGPAAALPQISPMEPITTPFPRAQRRPLEPGSPAQRSAATQLGRRVQQHRAQYSGENQRPLSSVGVSSLCSVARYSRDFSHVKYDGSFGTESGISTVLSNC